MLKKAKSSAKKTAPGVNMGALLGNAMKNFKKAKERAQEDRGFEEFDDGRYLARLTDVVIEKSQASKRTQLRMVWEFLEGDYEGKSKHSFQGMDTEDNLTFALRDIDRLGFDVAEMDDLKVDLPAVIAELKKTKPVAKIRLKTKGDFQNVYIDSLVDDADVEETEDDEDEEEAAPKSKAKAKAKTSKKKPAADEDEEEEAEEDEDEEEEAEDDEESEDEESEDDEEEESEDDTEDETEEDEISVRVGSQVTVQTKDGKQKGEILDVDEAENKVRVKITKSGKTLKLSAEKILSVDDVPDEPKAKAKAKTAAPKKKR